MGERDFREELLESGLLVDGGVPGLYHRSPEYERVVRSLEGYVSEAGRNEQPRRLFFAPVIALGTLEGSGYLSSFPNLMGTINSFTGGERELVALRERAEVGGDWASLMSPTEVGVGSAACHSIYPMVAGWQQPIPEGGLRFEVQANCFRHEPSMDPGRMQSFRMHEFVYLGTADGAVEHRERWLARSQELLGALGLQVGVEEANDPFFGRVGQLLAAGQLEKSLKFEVVAPISSTKPGAIGSGNYHEDHFGATFDLTVSDGTVAHSACFGFGLDRITLALVFEHGFDADHWPSVVKGLLALD